MDNILIASFDMEVGGVERSLISMLNSFDYSNNQVDLMLYSHTGDFMDLLPQQPCLLPESSIYKTFRLPVSTMLKKGMLPMVVSRLAAKYKAGKEKSSETGYKQMQYMWQYALPFLPKLDKEYNIAISYLWPHYFVAEKVKAERKIAWVHTDFSTVETDVEMDLRIWKKFHYIIAVSEACKQAFVEKYPSLRQKVTVIENISSPELVRALAEEATKNPMIYDKKFKVITVARLSHAKGIDNAVRALKILQDRGHRNIAWYVVGYGGDEGVIRQLIKENQVEESFILLGKQINPYPFIKAADLYVQPSRYEGKAVTVVEAQILAKPVLVTNYPTASSQVKQGWDGMICEMSVEGLADGIEKLYRDAALRSTLADNCYRTNYKNDQELEKLYQLV